MSRIHDLELARQRRLHQTELVKRDEDARRLKLKTVALRDDNAALKENLSQKDSYYRQWIKQRDQLRAELDEARDMIRSHETRAKKQNLEMTNLKVRILAHVPLERPANFCRPRWTPSRHRCRTLAKLCKRNLPSRENS